MLLTVRDRLELRYNQIALLVVAQRRLPVCARACVSAADLELFAATVAPGLCRELFARNRV